MSFLCPVEGCKRSKRAYKTRKGLDSHLKAVHAWTQSQIWELYAEAVQCPECSKSLPNDLQLDAHLATVHNWTVDQVIARIRDHPPEAADLPVSEDAGPSLELPFEEEVSVASEEAPPLSLKDQIIQEVIKELGKFGATQDAKLDERLKPIEEFQGLLDKTLRGAPNPQPGAQATPAATQLPAGALKQGQVSDLATLARTLGLVEGPKSGLANLAETLTTARLIANAMNPPSAWDGVQDAIMIRILSRQGLLTDAEAARLKKDTA